MKRIIVDLQVPGELHYEEIAIKTAVQLATEFGFSKERANDIKTAVSEAVINAMEHSCQQGKQPPVQVIFSEVDSSLQIEVCDSGPPFDPSQIQPPQIREKLDSQSSKRGWGLYLIRQLSDEFNISSSEIEGNRVSIRFHLK